MARFCEDCGRSLVPLEVPHLGVDQFAVYLQHDVKDETLQAYGEKVIPALADTMLAKT